MRQLFNFAILVSLLIGTAAFVVPAEKEERIATPKGYPAPRALSFDQPTWVDRANDMQEQSLDSLKLETLSDNAAGKRPKEVTPTVRRTKAPIKVRRTTRPTAARTRRR